MSIKRGERYKSFDKIQLKTGIKKKERWKFLAR